MSSDYEALLNATIEQLQSLKRTGVQFIRIEADTLQTLAKPIPRKVTPMVTAREHQGEVVAAAPVAAFEMSREPLSAEEKEAAMTELRCRAMQCQKCPSLASTRKNVVFGTGNIHTELMFVGEAPGADEDAAGEPFVGKAGQLLTKIIQVMGYNREKVYIANILKCRPDTPGQLSGNRKPTADEMKTCLPYLLAQIQIIKPKAIVALGGTAVEGLFGKTAGIMKLRGNWQSFQNIPVMPTYHPAYLLRNQSISEKRKVWEDMLQVLEKLNQPISDKQRNYFLKAG
ncbi:MAG: uracil-DNA glycosylase [Verrucomicrobia bacterium]|nr:uracil-DNA glycosylase [Verrucomicrobiota bacterium]